MTGVSSATSTELLAALESSGRTVTQFLEDLAREPVDADIISQAAGPAGDDNPLGLAPDGELVRRAVVLTGRASGRAFVYAESSIAAERIPGTVRHRLERSRDPIGRVLMDHHLTVRREPLDGPVVPEVSAHRVGALLRESALARRYRILIGGGPAMVVSEWFLRSVPDALASSGRHLPSGHATGG